MTAVPRFDAVFVTDTWHRAPAPDCKEAADAVGYDMQEPIRSAALASSLADARQGVEHSAGLQLGRDEILRRPGTDQARTP